MTSFELVILQGLKDGDAQKDIIFKIFELLGLMSR